MRRTLKNFAIGSAVTLSLWLVAPAFSLEDYLPDAEQFSQALPEPVRLDAGARAALPAALLAGGDQAAGPVRWLTDPVEAPGRFDAVGLAGFDGLVEIRVRDGEEPWSDWVETSDRDPLWVGGAEEVQVRSRGAAPEGELSYVNVSGDATFTDRLVHGLRGAVNAAVIGIGSIAADEAIADAPKPRVLGRRGWDPKGECAPRKRPEIGVVKGAAVHHTVSLTNYDEASVPSMVLAICLYHRNTNGWNDIGYNALVDRFGNLYAGRAGGLGRAVVGAHSQGFNAQTTGIAAIGTHTNLPLSRRAMQAAARYLAWKLAHHGTPALGKATMVSAGGDVNRYPEGKKVRVPRITGHTTFDVTACPGDALISQLPKLRRKVARRISAYAETEEPPVLPPDDGGGGSGGPAPDGGGGTSGGLSARPR